jgi:hypothetical protein
MYTPYRKHYVIELSTCCQESGPGDCVGSSNRTCGSESNFVAHQRDIFRNYHSEIAFYLCRHQKICSLSNCTGRSKSHTVGISSPLAVSHRMLRILTVELYACQACAFAIPVYAANDSVELHSMHRPADGCISYTSWVQQYSTISTNL